MAAAYLLDSLPATQLRGDSEAQSLVAPYMTAVAGPPEPGAHASYACCTTPTPIAPHTEATKRVWLFESVPRLLSVRRKRRLRMGCPINA